MVTSHALDEMDDDTLSIFDVKRAILPGEIVERQRETRTKEWKYLVKGNALDGRELIVVKKIGLTDKLVVITVGRREHKSVLSPEVMERVRIF